MAEQKVMNRWLVALGALIVQLSLGVIYAWSVFVKPLEKDFGWTRTQTSLAFTISVAVFALVMIYAGRLQDRIGPRIVCTIGGVIMAIGFLLASFTSSLAWLYISYGVIVGAGIAFSYVTPIGALVKWFPDKRGLMTGVAVAGFGWSAMIFAPLANQIIQSQGWAPAFRILGIIFLIAVVGGAQLVRNPPEGWVPAGWTPPQPVTTATGAEARVDYEPRELFSVPQAWMLWIMYAFHASAGLMVIGHLSPYGQARGLEPATAAAAVGILSIFNGAGRILAGWISDLIGRRWTFVLMFSITTITMAVILWALGGTFIGLSLAVALVGLAYGSNFALFPATTADFFGTKNIGANYALIFTAWGVAGIIGPIIGGRVYDATGSYLVAFYIAAALAAIAAILGFLLRAPAPREAPAEA